MAKQNRKPKTAQTATRQTMVDNPMYQAEHAEAPGNPRRIRVEINTRESAIETLYSRKFLGFAQKKAADKFRALYEAAGGKTAGIDYTSDRVDGGRADPVVAKLAAAQELKRCRELIGRRGYSRIEAVCGEGRSLGELSQDKRDRLTMADNLRADLDDIASLWGLRTRPRDL